MDKTLNIGDANTGELLKTLEGHAARVASIVYIAVRKRIVSGDWSKTIKSGMSVNEQTYRLWLH